MINVNDVVDVNIFCMNHEDNFNGKVFDVGTSDNISLNEIKDIVLEYFPGVEFNYIPDRAGDVAFTQADTQPLRSFGWSSNIDIKTGIADCFRRLVCS